MTVVVLVKVVVFTFAFEVELDKVTICDCLVDVATVVVFTTDTLDAKLLVAVVGTSLIY